MGLKVKLYDAVMLPGLSTNEKAENLPSGACSCCPGASVEGFAPESPMFWVIHST